MTLGFPPRTRLLAALVAGLVLGACGGGGGGSAPAPAPVELARDLGTIPATSPTFFDLEVVNPFGSAGEVTLESVGTPLVVGPGALPAAIGAGATVQVSMAFVPAGEGAAMGEISVRLRAGTREQVQLTRVTATAVGASLSVPGGPIDFGDVLPGSFANRTILLQNQSVLSPLSVTSVVSSHPGFVAITPFPLQVPAGGSASLVLRYNGSTPGTPTTTFTVTSNAVNGPHAIQALGTTGGQEIIDLGAQAFDGNGDTAAMTFDVPPDAISFMIEATVSGNTQVGLRRLTGPGGKVYENEQLTGAYIWTPASPVFTAQVPNTDRTDVQLVPGGGTYTLRLLRWSGSASSTSVKVIVQRRPRTGTDVLSTLDLNVFLANVITPKANTAAGDSTLQTVFGVMDNILQQQGIRLGDIDYYDMTNSAYDDVTQGEFGPMLATSSAASERRLNLFFVRTALGGGVLGVAATIGGPSVNGTQLSGVMSLYDPGNANLVGLVAAHEIGHFVGLAHTVESAQNGGGHDDITDTLECPSTGTNSVCSTAGGGYLMHWQAVGGSTITDGQGLVIRGHPLMGPRLLGGSPLFGKPFLPPPEIEITVDISPDWCGTCRQLGPKGN
ncbi:MAG: M12 family metallo-peptidase [Planctomycetota bacterium]